MKSKRKREPFEIRGRTVGMPLRAPTTSLTKCSARQTREQRTGKQSAEHTFDRYEIRKLTWRPGGEAGGGEAPGMMRRGRRGGGAIETVKENALGVGCAPWGRSGEYSGDPPGRRGSEEAAGAPGGGLHGFCFSVRRSEGRNWASPNRSQPRARRGVGLSV